MLIVYQETLILKPEEYPGRLILAVYTYRRDSCGVFFEVDSLGLGSQKKLPALPIDPYGHEIELFEIPKRDPSIFRASFSVISWVNSPVKYPTGTSLHLFSPRSIDKDSKVWEVEINDVTIHLTDLWKR
jgi:hypothetical protein